MMSMVGGGKNLDQDEDITVENEDPFLAVQKDLAKGLKDIR
jgi:hypothetical protein